MEENGGAIGAGAGGAPNGDVVAAGEATDWAEETCVDDSA